MPSHDFGILLGLAYRGFVERLHADLASHGLDELGPAYGYVLRMLDGEPELRQADLAARLGMTRAGLGKIVDGMVRRGFLTRDSAPDDARAWALRIGPQGGVLLRRARAFHARFERELAEQLGEPVAATRRVLEHIVATTLGAEALARLRPL